MHAEAMGRVEEALAEAERAYAIAERFGNADLQALALVVQGTVLVLQGELDRGLALFDEASTSALTGGLDPFAATVVYCMTITGSQNVGDFERVARTVSGVALLAAASSVPRTLRVPLGLIGAVAALSGVSGWCPVYHYARVTSLGGPGDRPDEATRNEWLAERPGGPAVPSAHEEAV